MTRARPKPLGSSLIVPRRSTTEKSPDELNQKDRVHGRRALLDHFSHLDPGGTSPLPPVLDHTNYIVGAGADTRVALGALLEVLLIIANVGTAVVLFPVLKRQNESLALGYVSARLVESTFIAIGIVSLLAVVTLRQDLAGAAGGDRARS